MRIITATLVLCLQGSMAFADDLSPWFGSAGQKPFRIETTTAATTPADQTATNSIEPPLCDIAGCPNDGKTANANKGQAGLSQN